MISVETFILDPSKPNSFVSQPAFLGSAACVVVSAILVGY
jgi:hypothetical protein